MPADKPAARAAVTSVVTEFQALYDAPAADRVTPEYTERLKDWFRRQFVPAAASIPEAPAREKGDMRRLTPTERAELDARWPAASPLPAPAGAGTPGGETFDLAQQLNDFFNATQDGDEDAGQIAQDAIVDEFTRLAARLAEADAAREAAEQLVAAAIEVNQRYIGGSPLKGAFGDALDRLATAQFNASRTLAAARAALAAPPTGDTP